MWRPMVEGSASTLVEYYLMREYATTQGVGQRSRCRTPGSVIQVWALWCQTLFARHTSPCGARPTAPARRPAPGPDAPTGLAPRGTPVCPGARVPRPRPCGCAETTDTHSMAPGLDGRG